jgi:hypothetical protein
VHTPQAGAGRVRRYRLVRLTPKSPAQLPASRLEHPNQV